MYVCMYVCITLPLPIPVTIMNTLTMFVPTPKLIKICTHKTLPVVTIPTNIPIPKWIAANEVFSGC